MTCLNRRDAIISMLLGISSFALGRDIMKGDNKKTPAIFLGHGSPMNAVTENNFTKALSNLGEKLTKPKAIIMISAHWETNGTYVTGMERPKTIHDFYGFPKKLFDIQYPANGNPELAKKISKNIDTTEITLDMNKWGLDHGTWSVLRHIYPNADVPVIQLSIDRTKPLAFHYEMGKKLKFLREQGVMLMGSGNIVHNLREINWDVNAKPHDWAIEFDNWVKEKLLARDFKSLVEKPLSFTAGKLSHPTIEHYIPLLYVLGASDQKDLLNFDFEGIQNASASMRSFQFFES